MTITDYLQTLSDNPYFGAGFGLFGLGAGAALLRKGMQIGMIMFRRHYMITLEVPCRDKSYQWVLQWITYKGAKETQHLSVETSFEQRDTGHIKTRYDFIPSIGTHIIRLEITVLIAPIHQLTMTSMRLLRSYPEAIITVTLTEIPGELDKSGTNQGTANIGHTNGYTMGNGAAHSVRKKQKYILQHSGRGQMALKEHEGKTIMYTAMGSEWRQFGHPRKRRPLESVVLDTDIAERIINDCRDFINTPAWYSDRGIPYRRGYLLYGPPGCGKSSFITALAGELERGICVLNLSERGLTDDRLNHLLAMAPQQTIVLLEDIDAAFSSREESKDVKGAYDGLNRVTFSGLLNCLDGVASTEARILFMTTNYLERLDPALVRPGRVDVKEYIGWCSARQVEQMFLRFYKNAGDKANEIAAQFAEEVMSQKRNVSPAQIQGFFMFYKNSPNDVLKNVSHVWELT